MFKADLSFFFQHLGHSFTLYLAAQKSESPPSHSTQSTVNQTPSTITFTAMSCSPSSQLLPWFMSQLILVWTTASSPTLSTFDQFSLSLPQWRDYSATSTYKPSFTHLQYKFFSITGSSSCSSPFLSLNLMSCLAPLFPIWQRYLIAFTSLECPWIYIVLFMVLSLPGEHHIR